MTTTTERPAPQRDRHGRFLATPKPKFATGLPWYSVLLLCGVPSYDTKRLRDGAATLESLYGMATTAAYLKGFTDGRYGPAATRQNGHGVE